MLTSRLTHRKQQLVPSDLGRQTYIYQGYDYVKKQKTNTKTHWIFRHNRQIQYPSLLMTSGNENINTPRDQMGNFKLGTKKA